MNKKHPTESAVEVAEEFPDGGLLGGVNSL